MSPAGDVEVSGDCNNFDLLRFDERDGTGIRKTTFCVISQNGVKGRRGRRRPDWDHERKHPEAPNGAQRSLDVHIFEERSTVSKGTDDGMIWTKFV